MRRVLVGLSALLSAAALLPGAAHASAPGPCPFMVDATGDETPMLGRTSGADPMPGAAALDLRSADITSDTKDLSVVIRVSDLSDADPTQDAHVYAFYFSAEGTQFALAANVSSDGDEFSAASGPATTGDDASAMSVIGDIKGLVNVGRNEIWMTVPVSLLRKHGAVGGLFDLKAFSARQAQSPNINEPLVRSRHVGFLNNEDEVTTAHGYRLGKRGCIPVMR